MTEFEDQLRRALERKEPSGDFAARVLARASAARRPAAWPNWRAWAAAGVAASLCLGGLGFEMQHRRQVRDQGEAARAQLIQAMHITSSKLQKIQKKVRGAL
jgi:hypothetical protein